MYSPYHPEESICDPARRGHICPRHRDGAPHPDVPAAGVPGKDYHYSGSPSLHHHPRPPDPRLEGLHTNTHIYLSDINGLGGGAGRREEKLGEGLGEGRRSWGKGWEEAQFEVLRMNWLVICIRLRLQ